MQSPYKNFISQTAVYSVCMDSYTSDTQPYLPCMFNSCSFWERLDLKKKCWKVDRMWLPAVKAQEGFFNWTKSRYMSQICFACKFYFPIFPKLCSLLYFFCFTVKCKNQRLVTHLKLCTHLLSIIFLRRGVSAHICNIFFQTYKDCFFLMVAQNFWMPDQLCNNYFLENYVAM